MLRIGDFSKLGQVTIKALKVYEREGLLSPAHVSTDSGYRFYNASQLTRLNRIRVMKDLGLSLREIRELLDRDFNDHQIRGLLQAKRDETRQQMAEHVQRLDLIEQRLLALEHLPDGAIEDIVVRELSDLDYHCFRHRCSTFESGVELMMQIVEVSRRHRHAAKSRYLGVGHTDCFADRDIDVEMGLIGVAGQDTIRIDAEHELRHRRLPGHERVACVVRSGTLTGHLVATASVAAWIDARGLVVSGPHRELVVEVGEQGMPTTVELQFPVATASASDLPPDS